MRGDRIESFAPEPVPFRPGSAEPAEAATAQLDQLAGLVGAAPAMRVEVTGVAGGPDVRALQEAAVLAALQAPQGWLGGVRNLPSRGDRNAVRAALERRARGETVELEPEPQARLDEWAAEQTVDDARLAALATARAERLRALLLERYGVTADRVTLGEPAADRAGGAPAVRLVVGSR
jgi:hypothetical protein